MVDLVAVLKELGIYEVFELLVAFQKKFLINKRGEVVHRYAPTTKPESIASDIEKALAESA